MSKFDPLEYPICLTFPARLAPSAWIEHVPFAMCLIDAMRPRVFVELGSHYGVSYCAFCQSVKEVGAQTKCYAVDTWQGDPQAGIYGQEVLDELRRHHDPLYGSFSRLLQSTFEEAAEHFPAGSIDLLHIDGFHTYDAVRADFETWLPKMSERGVILFHDINVRERDFGVWRLWDELKAKYPHYEVMYGHGLGVIAVGTETPAALAGLFDGAEEELRRVREFFYQLGVRLEVAQELESLKQSVKDRDERAREREQRMRQEHPLLARTSNFLQVCADEGLGSAVRLGVTKARGKVTPGAEATRDADDAKESNPAETTAAAAAARTSG
ncbi:MAG: class I SAM-dependent methyltransferase [Pyrinomonadaceae bacterium]